MGCGVILGCPVVDAPASEAKIHISSSLPSNQAVELVEVRSGSLNVGVVLLLGSVVAWHSLIPRLHTELGKNYPVVCVSFPEQAGTDRPHTIHGAAIKILSAVRARYQTNAPLNVLAFEYAGHAAHAVATLCLMQDHSLGLCGIIDQEFSPDLVLAEEDLWLSYLVESSRKEERSGKYFDISWFACSNRQPRDVPNERLQGQTIRHGDIAGLLHSVASSISVGQINPTVVGGNDPLITIQHGRNGGEVYFCLPGAGAGVLDFLPFSMAIGGSHAVHALQSRGMCGEYLPSGSVESTAVRYLNAINSHYPIGDINLVGHSFGGWIAFEMAIRFQAAGRRIGSLTLLDSEVPGYSRRVGHDYTRVEAIMLLVALYEQAAGRSMGLNHDTLEALSCDEQLRLLHRQLVSVGLLPRTSKPDQLHGVVRSFEAAVRTRYQPKTKFEGSANLILVIDSKERVEDGVLRQAVIAEGWRRFAPHLKFRREAGNHMTLLKAPHIEDTVRWMKIQNTRQISRPLSKESRTKIDTISEMY